MGNSSELNNLVTWIVAFLVTTFVRWGMTADQASQIATAIGGMIPLAVCGLYSVYMHWNMRKVPEKSVVVAIAPTVADAKAASIPAAK